MKKLDSFFITVTKKCHLDETNEGHEEPMPSTSSSPSASNIDPLETKNQQFQPEVPDMSAVPSSKNVKKLEKKAKRNLSDGMKVKLQEQFKWLNSKKDHFYCTVCSCNIVGTKFHILRHARALSHVNRVEACKRTPQIQNIIKDPDKEKITVLVRKAELRYCAYVAEHNLPFILMDSLPSFCKSIYPDSQIAKLIKMKRFKATKLIVGVIAPYIQRELADQLKNTVFSIIIDETTDVSTQKALIVIVRSWDDKTLKVTDKIFDLIKIEECTADGLFHEIKNLIDKYKIPYKNIIGFAADNASTMMGHLNGVQAKLADLSPGLYVQGCASHSLHLCASAAANKLPNNVEQFTSDIYSYFSHSSKRLNELKECQIFIKEKPTKILYPSQTRWLSLKQVVNRILEHWDSLQLFFTRAALEDNLPVAKSILNALRSDIYKLYMYFLSHILEIVIKVNIEFQAESPQIPFFLEKISNLYKIILRCFIKKEILDTVPIQNINVGYPRNYVDITKIYFGARSDSLLAGPNNVTPDELQSFRLKALDFYIELSSQIKKRFNFKDEILKFASNFSPTKALSGEILSLGTFPNLFPNIEVNIEAANTEWLYLNEIDSGNINKFDLTNFWSKVSSMTNALNEEMFPNLMKIVKVILSLPHSSATAERGFSYLTLIKTNIRNRLLVSTCAALLIFKDMLHKLEGGSLNWVPPKDIINFDNQAVERIIIEE